MIRTAKLLLLLSITLDSVLIVFDNLTDYNSNFQFVRHVLLMDTTFPGNHGMGRSIASPAVDSAFYVAIIAWEIVTAVVLAWGCVRLLRAVRQPAAAFHAAKSLPVLGLTLSLLMWLVAFLAIGGDWFLMWQSNVWNGQQAASRNFTVFGIVLLFLVLPDSETQA